MDKLRHNYGYRIRFENNNFLKYTQGLGKESFLSPYAAYAAK
jgi:hypothetical protein